MRRGLVRVLPKSFMCSSSTLKSCLCWYIVQQIQSKIRECRQKGEEEEMALWFHEHNQRQDLTHCFSPIPSATVSGVAG